MENNTKKMQLGAGIAAALCVVALIISIVLNGAGKNNGNSEVPPTENTEVKSDVEAPKVTLSDKIIFTNDIAAVNAESLLESVEEDSEYTAKFIRYEKKDVLHIIDAVALEQMEKEIIDFATDEEALSVGTEEIPALQGVYRCVLEVADIHKNATYREVYVVLDKTPARIDEVEDMVIVVPADKLTEQPKPDMSIYKGYDEVDGALSSDSLTIEVLLKNEARHEWTVTVSHTDRAGNESKMESLIRMEEEKKQAAEDNKDNTSQNTDQDTSSNNTGNAGNTESGNNAGNNAGNASGTQTPPSEPQTYHPADTDKDGTLSAEEQMRYITPEKQACIDAGYGVVCEFYGGEEFEGTWYAVLMKDIDHTIDGKTGKEILREYLHERDLEGTIGGCWINSENEWYWFIAENIHEWITPEDDNYWDM